MADYRLDTVANFEIKGESDGWGRFLGVASHADPDRLEDRILSSAWTDAVRAVSAENPLPLLFAHQSAVPIGRVERLSIKGPALIAAAAVRLTVAKGRETWDLIRSKCLQGLSVGFRAQPEDVKYDQRGHRTLSKCSLFEISVCAIPCQPRATITTLLSYDAANRRDAAAQTILARLESGDAANHIRTQAHLNAIGGKMAALLINAAEVGAVELKAVEPVIRSILADIRSNA
jgi:HK97 family phage prohead protease